MSKTYKGYELMKLVSEGKLGLKQKVNSLSLDYKNCTIDFVLKDIAFNVMDLDFKLIEDNTIDDIEELKEEISTNSYNWISVDENRRMINKLIRKLEQHEKEIKELKER